MGSVGTFFGPPIVSGHPQRAINIDNRDKEDKEQNGSEANRELRRVQGGAHECAAWSSFWEERYLFRTSLNFRDAALPCGSGLRALGPHI